MTVQSQTKFVNEFLNIGVGGRAHGMFGSVIVTVSDGTAGYWNPAALTAVKSPLQFNAMHANWFGGIANYDYLSIAKPFNNRSAGSFSIIRMGIDNIPNTLNLIGPDGSVDYNRVLEFSAADYGALFSYGRFLGQSDQVSVGLTAKVIHRSIGSFGSSWGFGFDLGSKFTIGEFNFAIVARDITTTFNAWSFSLSESDKDVFIRTGNDIPVSSTEIALPRFILGAAYPVINGQVGLLLEANAMISTDGRESAVLSGNRFSVDPTIGAEVDINNIVFIRAGVGNIQRILNENNTRETNFEFQPNVGMGLKLGRMNIDYALTNIGSLSGVLASHIFSLKLDFQDQN